ncbi:hypothetical protein DQ04_00391010 [Trypanosoma grayi]|uniref:hypothetical protein n=1 Tax=Trypanosoma grayi TaxID=71804 RepID=UPI0004F40084|nr:hypothetical protein DQ04_00391010 [Trypanosoma grayi]KEG14579.1 hypothetical protein DQ04_00391010 [Trypanosoma grayi]
MHSAMRRDETLHHEEWLQLRGAMGLQRVSRAPFGDTPCRAAAAAAETETPERQHDRRCDTTLRMSPICAGLLLIFLCCVIGIVFSYC